MSEFDNRPVAGMGAEVHGLDLDAIDEGVAAQLTKALGDHLMLALPGLDPSLRGLRDVAALFGTVDPALHLSVTSTSQRSSASTAAPGQGDLCTPTPLPRQPPAIAPHMVDCPSHGGDTMFIDGHAVYDSLSPAMQGFLAGLTVSTTTPAATRAPSIRWCAPTPTWTSGVVRQQAVLAPDSGCPTESQMPLSYLFDGRNRFSSQPGVSPGDVVMWDERVTLHIMVNDTVGVASCDG